jgi:Tfp pilus assembly protein PilV
MGRARALARVSRVNRARTGFAARLRGRGQLGESLIELLATITIVSICVVGLVAALGMNFMFSAGNEQVDDAHAILSRYAEAIASEPYESCTAGTPYTAAAIADIPATDLPSGTTTGAPGTIANSGTAFAPSIESVHYWNGDSAPATFTATCGATDPGYQQLVVRVDAGDGSYYETMTIYKRLP